MAITMLSKWEEYLQKKGLEWTLHQEIDEDRQNSLWYGGNILSVYVPSEDMTFTIKAAGEIRMHIFGYENPFSKTIVHKDTFVDKRNEGAFYQKHKFDIVNDEQLLNLFDASEEEPHLLLESGNWFEIEVIHREQILDWDWVMDAEFVTDAIDELAQNIDKYVSDVMQYANK